MNRPISLRYPLATLISLLFFAAGISSAADPYSADRARMVHGQIERRGVRNREVLRVMRETPRHLFVPAAYRERSYADHPLPIGYDATISQPYVVAWMTELLEPAKTDRVLEIGTGSGYQAAVLAQLVARVYTIEIVEELANSARQLLKSLGYGNVAVRRGNGYRGWPEEAPFDKIILTAAPPEVPQALLDQLAVGGRLVAPVGDATEQKLIVVHKDLNGRIRRQDVGGVTFVPLRPEK